MLVAYALIQLASGPAAMIQAAGPLITALVARLVFAEERLGGRRFGGILLGMAGVALLIGPRLFEGAATALSLDEDELRRLAEPYRPHPISGHD